MQEAYWTNVNWTAVGTFSLALGALALPFIKDLITNWRSGRSADALTGAKAAETAAERIDRLHASEYARLAADRDYWERRAKEAMEDAGTVEADEENARRDGQGMEDWARWYRHMALNLGQRFQALVGLCERAASGDLAMERFQQLIKQIVLDPVRPLPQVPQLSKAASERPPE